jgi:hypothetical protein
MARLLRTRENGTDESILVEPENGTDFKLKQLYTLLGCSLVEVIRLSDEHIMIIDEEGKCTDEEWHVVNVPATRVALLAHAIAKDDYIVGAALICRDEEFR